MKQWQVLKVRKDIASGKNADRDGFSELAADIAKGRIDVVVVYRLDRLSRNVRDIYDFLDTIKTSNIAFVSVTEGFDTTTAMGRAMLGVAAVFAQLTREMISENTKDGMMRRAEAGHFRGNLLALYGYDYDQDRGILVVNLAEAEVIKQVFDWYTEQKWGQEKIARILNQRGIPTKKGNQWGRSSLVGMLENPVYFGAVRLNGGFVVGKHEPIVSRELWEQVHQILRARKKLPNRSQQSQHLLSGVAVCGKCGRRLFVHHIHAGSINEDGSKKTYRYYLHPRSVEVGEKSCSGVCKKVDQVDAVVIKEIEKAALGSMKDLVIEDVRHRAKNESAPLSRERDKLSEELLAINEKFSKWADLLDKCKIDEEQFVYHNERLLARKRAIQKRLAELDLELACKESVEVSLAEVKKALEDFPRVWSALEFEEQRELLRLLIESLKVFKTHAELKLLFLDQVTIPLDFPRGRKKSKPQGLAVAPNEL